MFIKYYKIISEKTKGDGIMGKVYELLNLIDENTNVNVIRDDEVIAVYDGRNSIPESLNDEEVIKISTENDSVELYI